jgi:hypothetical protein
MHLLLDVELEGADNILHLLGMAQSQGQET